MSASTSATCLLSVSDQHSTVNKKKEVKKTFLDETPIRKLNNSKIPSLRTSSNSRNGIGIYRS
jgi:hypothetical protein